MNGYRREVLKVIDANFNRSREGLRVCEDIARFVVGSGALASEIKKLRHGISANINKNKSLRAELLKERDSDNDCGREPMPEIEIKRSGIDDIFVANIERSKESLRVLEEFFKLIDMRVSAGFSRLRFDAYGIEKRALKKIEVFMSKSQHARSGQ